MSDTKYEIPPHPVSRPRYFDNELLIDSDFIDEQSYHIAHQRRHERLLHVSGVTEGLEVSIPVQEPTKISVSAGSAIDDSGRHIFLKEGKMISGPGITGDRYVVISFFESTPNEQGKRWTQDPKLTLSEALPLEGVCVGKVRVNQGIVESIVPDGSNGRVYSGVRLPGPAAGVAPVLRAIGSGHAQMSGALSVTGKATLHGGLTVENGVTVTGVATLNNDLTVTGVTTLVGGLKGVTVTGAATLNNDLTVTGAATLNGVVTVTGAASLNGGATVTGALTVQGEAGSLTVGGGATAPEGGLNVSGAASVGSLRVGGTTVSEVVNGGNKELRIGGILATTPSGYAALRVSDIVMGTSRGGGKKNAVLSEGGAVGRALVDFPDGSLTCLHVNFDSDWATTKIGGGVVHVDGDMKIKGSVSAGSISASNIWVDPGLIVFHQVFKGDNDAYPWTEVKVELRVSMLATLDLRRWYRTIESVSQVGVWQIHNNAVKME